MDAKDVKDFFESVAGEWDDMRATFYNASVIDALVKRAGIDREATVVDVGCGTGFVAAGMSARAQSVIGVDNSPAMLAVAADNLAVLNLDNVTLLEGALNRLPLENDSVDAAVANMVLHHAEQPAAMLAEMHRVVRPGGVVAVTDEVAHHYEWMRTEQADIWLGFTKRDVGGFFESAGLRKHGYARLGMQ
jgi:ubiquinone/menaquinone biosynthesis C-methylase UbiE